MDLILRRYLFTEFSTIGEIIHNGKFICYTLEDKDRGIYNDMPENHIRGMKIMHKTAIGYGRYEVVMSYSNRFKKYLPLLVGVKGFEGIRIHTGNYTADTSGCILPGLDLKKDSVLQSRDGYNELMKIMEPAFTKEKVFIEIVSGESHYLGV